MGSSLKPASLADVRAAIAFSVRGDTASPSAVGGITLLVSQRDCVRRAREAISRYGGVLIASDVGSGKTFVALTIAREYAQPVVFAPAALRTMWSAAMARAHATIPFVSLESLGHGRPPPLGHDVVIVDEAHHLRNPLTRTYRAVERATGGARVVLLSATPVHNRARDLDALLALFLGGDAADLDDEARARVVVRGSESVAGPRVLTHAVVGVRDVAGVVAAISALPPPVRVRDGGVATVLMRLSLLRAWCSSAGALAAMLRRASLRAAALADAFRAGRHPTRQELTAFSDNGQLAFAELVASGAVENRDAIVAVDAHRESLASLRELVRRHVPLDDERAHRLTEIAARHPGMPVLACTQYAATVDALWSRLRARPGVAALTSRGARIASGPIGRDEALARFAPVAQRARAPHERERIHLLIATDLVSEGMNLHDAGVVVHLDLPWTAARLAQRVGRIARMGSPHECVHAYEIAPPHAAAAALTLVHRLRRKRRIAARLVGGDRRFAELLGGTVTPRESAVEARARIVQTLAPFAPAEILGAEPLVCAVTAPRAGWLALIGSRAASDRAPPTTSSPAPPTMRLVVRTGRTPPTTDPCAVADGVSLLATGTEHPLDPNRAALAAKDAARWLERERGRRLAGIGRRHAARAQGPSRAAVIGVVNAAPAHERAKAAGTASAKLLTLASSAQSTAAEFLLALVVFCEDGKPPRRPPL